MRAHHACALPIIMDFFLAILYTHLSNLVKKLACKKFCPRISLVLPMTDCYSPSYTFSLQTLFRDFNLKTMNAHARASFKHKLEAWDLH